MALSALDDPAAEPTDEQVASVLGDSLQVWDALKGRLRAQAGVDGWRWGSSGKKYGWALRAQAGKRNIAYLIPQHGHFLVGLVLGGRAMEIARGLELSASVREIVETAPRYGEGTGFRLPVREMSDLHDIQALVMAKLGRPPSPATEG